jgi:hypothetical protein
MDNQPAATALAVAGAVSSSVSLHLADTDLYRYVGVYNLYLK